MKQKNEEAAVNGREKMKLVPGVRYKGWAFVNEYGELHFEASQRRDNPNNMKLVKENDCAALYESKNCWRCTITMKKDPEKTQHDVILDFTRNLWGCVQLLRKYVPNKIY